MSKQLTFGERVRELRKAKNLSQRELADAVANRFPAEDRRGFDFTYLSKIENGKSAPPSIATIQLLAQVLGADEHELIALAGKGSPGFGEILKESGAARAFYRSALNAELSEADWEKLLQELKRRTDGHEDPPKPGD
jgi:HTH-type transcriptional regulator, competence development regulator